MARAAAPTRRPVRRIWFWVTLLLLLLLAMQFGEDLLVRRAHAQAGAAYSLYGSIQLGAGSTMPSERPRFEAATVTRGTLQVVTARTAEDLTECGRTDIVLGEQYEVQIVAVPACVAQTREGPDPDLMFLFNGVRIAQSPRGGCSVVPTLSVSQSLGQRCRADLVVGIGSALRLTPATTAPPLLRVRYWGTVVVEGPPGPMPAPDGLEVRVVVRRTATECQRQVTRVENGLYAVDVVARPDVCIARRTDPRPIFLELQVAGVQTDDFQPDPSDARYDNGLSLAAVGRHDVRLPSDFQPPQRATQDGEDADCEAAAVNKLAFRPIGQMAPQPGCTRLPAALLLRGDATVRLRLRACLSRFLAVQDNPHAGPVGDVLERLYALPASGPRITVEESDLELELRGGAPAVTLGNSSDVDRHRPTAARLVLPSFGRFEALQAIESAGGQLFGYINDGDYCQMVLHELVHALDYVSGTVPTGSCLVNGTTVDPTEVKAMAVQNAYRLSSNLQPLARYGEKPLPSAAVHPTADSWQRFRLALGPEICFDDSDL